MAVRYPPAVSGISRATVIEFVTGKELADVCKTLRRFVSPGADSMQAQANTINFALLDYLTAIRSRETRSAPGAVKDWAGHVSSLASDLRGSLGVGGPRHAHLEAWHILRGTLPREASDATAFQRVKGLLFQSEPDDYENFLRKNERMSNKGVMKLFDVFLRRSLHHLELLEFIAKRAELVFGNQMQPRGGGHFDHERRLLICTLLPVYQSLSGRAPSGSNVGGPTVQWFNQLLQTIRAKEECPDELAMMQPSKKTIANWINEARAACAAHPPHSIA